MVTTAVVVYCCGGVSGCDGDPVWCGERRVWLMLVVGTVVIAVVTASTDVHL